jgi:hypothetical protein
VSTVTGVTESIETNEPPDGAITMALSIVETLRGRKVGNLDVKDLADAIRLAMRVWGADSLVQAFGSIIYIGVNTAKHKPELGDLVQTLVPLIVRGLHDAQRPEVPDEALPTVSGLLTAAYFNQMPYEWRIQFGPIRAGEAMVFCYTACMVAQFMDDTVYGQPGRFAEVLTMGLATDTS